MTLFRSIHYPLGYLRANHQRSDYVLLQGIEFTA